SKHCSHTQVLIKGRAPEFRRSPFHLFLFYHHAFSAQKRDGRKIALVNTSFYKNIFFVVHVAAVYKTDPVFIRKIKKSGLNMLQDDVRKRSNFFKIKPELRGAPHFAIHFTISTAVYQYI